MRLFTVLAVFLTFTSLFAPAQPTSSGLAPAPTPRLKDNRLIGTWQSDADQTIAVIRELRPVSKEQEAALRKIFGKLRVTYAETKCTTELDGITKSHPYQVLGRDKVSVVIRSPVTELPPLKLSEFTIIHFEDANTYWLYTQIGEVKEYFKRVKEH